MSALFKSFFFYLNVTSLGLFPAALRQAALLCVVEPSCCCTPPSNTLIKTIQAGKFFYSTWQDKGSRCSFYSTVSLQWIKAEWLGLTFSPWKLFNIVMTTSNRGGKNKTGLGNVEWGGNRGWQHKSRRILWMNLHPCFLFLHLSLSTFISLSEAVNQPSFRTLLR